jgi:hypothetical protein
MLLLLQRWWRLLMLMLQWRRLLLLLLLLLVLWQQCVLQICGLLTSFPCVLLGMRKDSNIRQGREASVYDCSSC